jgi:hypothetical protein
MGSQQRFEVETHPRRPSLDSASSHRTPQIPVTSTTTSFINTDDIEEESKCSSLFYIKKRKQFSHNVEIFLEI